MPGLTAHTPITTQFGDKPICKLRRGDLVVTDEGELVPVLQVVRRIVPARGSFHPIRLRAPYFGLSRDIVVAPHQRLIMAGSQVEYIFSKEAVLVPARHLINDVSAFWAKGPEMAWTVESPRVLQKSGMISPHGEVVLYFKAPEKKDPHLQFSPFESCF